MSSGSAHGAGMIPAQKRFCQSFMTTLILFAQTTHLLHDIGARTTNLKFIKI
jgi:hypothetical protein